MTLLVIKKLMALKLNRFELLVMFGVKFFAVFVRASIMGFPLYANITPEWRCVPNTDTHDSPHDEAGPLSDIVAPWSKSCEVYYNCSSEIGGGGGGGSHLEFRSPFYSARQEFGLVCDHAHQAALIASIQFVGVIIGATTMGQAALIASIQFVGVLIGATTMGQVTDSFGRRYVYAFFMTGEIAFSAISSFSTSPVMLTVLRFLAGLFVGGEYVTGYVYTMEMIKPQQRMFMNAFSSMPASYMILSIQYATQDWRWSLRTLPLVSLPTVILLLTIMPESTKWAKDTGKEDLVKKSRRRVNWINGRASNYKDSVVAETPGINATIPEKAHLAPALTDAHKAAKNILNDDDGGRDCENFNDSPTSEGPTIEFSEKDGCYMGSATSLSVSGVRRQNEGTTPSAVHQKPKVPKIAVRDLISTRAMKVKTSVMCYLWLTAAIVSYTISFDSRNLDGNFYVNQAIMIAGHMSSGVLIFVFDTYVPGFSRRVLHQGPQAIMVLITLAIGVLYAVDSGPVGRSIITILALSTTYFMSPVWDAVYICTAEIFPTEARSTAYAVCNFFARLGVILAPQIILLRQVWAAGPYFIMTVISCGAFVLSYRYLPDTKDMDLPSNVQEASSLSAHHKHKASHV